MGAVGRWARARQGRRAPGADGPGGRWLRGCRDTWCAVGAGRFRRRACGGLCRGDRTRWGWLGPLAARARRVPPLLLRRSVGTKPHRAGRGGRPSCFDGRCRPASRHGGGSSRLSGCLRGASEPPCGFGRPCGGRGRPCDGAAPSPGRAAVRTDRCGSGGDAGASA